jgi:hypothetical protein
MYAAALPGIKQGLDESFANFAIDAPKLKNIPSLVNRLGKSIPRLVKSFAVAKRRFRSAKDLASALASTNLGFQFGLLPLIEDVQSLYKIALNVRKDINKLKASANTWRTSRQTFNGTCSTTTFTSPDMLGPWTSCGGSSANSYFAYKITKTALSDVRRLKLRYKYRMPKLPDWLANTFGVMDSLGLNFNPNIIWDATRFSFVVDWFIKVSPFIRQFQQTLLSPEVVAHICVHSRKTKVRVKGEITSSTGFTPWVCHDRVYTTYERWVDTPPIDQLKVDWNIDWFKVNIASSLLLK